MGVGAFGVDVDVAGAVGEHDGGLVIRADDGRVGVLRTTDGLTRG